MAAKKRPGRAKPAAIAASEMEYHRKVMGRYQWALGVQQEAAAAIAATQAWAKHLHEKYGLGPQDGVNENGRIVRAEAPVSTLPDMDAPE